MSPVVSKFLRHEVDQVQIHHPGVQRLARINTEGFFLEIFVRIQKTETVLLVKIYRFGPVVGIDNHKATTSFVIRVDKPGNQVINDLTPQVQAAALELTVNSQSSNQERRIRTRMLCIGHLVFQAVPRRLGNHCRFDVVMHRSERNRLDPHRRSRTRTGRYSCRWGKGCNQMLNGFFPLWASL